MQRVGSPLALLLLCAVALSAALPHGTAAPHARHAHHGRRGGGATRQAAAAAGPTPDQGILALNTSCSGTSGSPVYFTPGKCFSNPYAPSLPGPADFKPRYAQVWFNTADGIPLYQAYQDFDCTQLELAVQLVPSVTESCSPFVLTAPADGNGAPAPEYPPEDFVAKIQRSSDETNTIVSSWAVPQGRDVIQANFSVTHAVYCSENGTSLTIVQRHQIQGPRPGGNINSITVVPDGEGQSFYLYDGIVQYTCALTSGEQTVPSFPAGTQFITETTFPESSSHLCHYPLVITQVAVGVCTVTPELALAAVWTCPRDDSGKFVQHGFDVAVTGGNAAQFCSGNSTILTGPLDTCYFTPPAFFSCETASGERDELPAQPATTEAHRRHASSAVGHPTGGHSKQHRKGGRAPHGRRRPLVELF